MAEEIITAAERPSRTLDLTRRPDDSDDGLPALIRTRKQWAELVRVLYWLIGVIVVAVVLGVANWVNTQRDIAEDKKDIAAFKEWIKGADAHRENVTKLLGEVVGELKSLNKHRP